MENIKEKELMTASETLLKHGLNWQVEKRPVRVDGEIDHSTLAVKRMDTGQVFDYVSPRYEIVQNSDAFSWFDELVNTGQAKYTDAGCYGGGSKVWLRAKVPYNFSVVEGDNIETFVRIITSHDGSSKLMIFPEMFQIVCSNGMGAWTKDHARTVSVKHTKSVKSKFMQRSNNMLQREIEYFNLMKVQAQKLAKKQMSALEIDNFLVKLFDAEKYSDLATKSQNKLDHIRQLSISGINATKLPHVRHTAWGVYSAITEYTTHHQLVKGTPEQKTEHQDYSNNFGTGQALKDKAFTLLTS